MAPGYLLTSPQDPLPNNLTRYSKTRVRDFSVWIMSCSVTMLACLRSLSRDTAGSMGVGWGRSHSPTLRIKTSTRQGRARGFLLSLCSLGWWLTATGSNPPNARKVCPHVPDVETKAQRRVWNKNLGLQCEDYVTLDFHNPFLVSGKGPCSNP